MAGKDMVTRNPEIVHSTTESKGFKPTEEQIRCRAYEIYESRCRGGAGGNATADWDDAECELLARGKGDTETAPIRAESAPAE